jgi:hypothetical protein
MIIDAEFQEGIDKFYNKERMQSLFEHGLKAFILKHKQLYLDKGISLEALQKDKLKKTDYLDLFTPTLYDKELFQALLSFLPENVSAAFQYLILNWSPVPYKEIESKLRIELITKPDKNNSTHIKPEYHFLPFRNINNGYYSYDEDLEYIFFFPSIITEHLKGLIELPSAYVLTPITAPRESAFIFEGQEQALAELTLILAYAQQGNLKFTASGRAQAGSINKMKKYGQSREFFPDSDKELASIRHQLVAEALFYLTIDNSISNDISATLKNVLLNLKDGSYSILYNLLLHLKGTGYSKHNYENTYVNEYLYTILSELPDGEWLDIDNLCNHIFASYPSLQLVTDYTANSYLYLDAEEVYGNSVYKEREYIDLFLFRDAITIPMLKSVFFLMAAFGMADIAYDLPQNSAAAELGRNYFSMFDGLKAVRINALGAYILGKKAYFDFTPPRQENALRLEEDQLIIHFTGANPALSLALDKIAVPLSDSRYKTDYATFLKGCQNNRDIQAKIDLFHTYISDKPPRIWNDFFKELLSKYNPLIIKTEYSLLQIPAANKELISLIARDEVLKKLCIKAEEYHLLVKNSDMNAFRKRLEKFGYLLPR